MYGSTFHKHSLAFISDSNNKHLLSCAARHHLSLPVQSGSQSPFRKLRNFLTPTGRRRNLSGSSHSSDGSEATTLPSVSSSRKQSGVSMNRGVQLDQDWGSEDESHLAKIPTLTTSTALKWVKRLLGSMLLFNHCITGA